jgi:hypothetical protein
MLLSGVAACTFDAAGLVDDELPVSGAVAGTPDGPAGEVAAGAPCSGPVLPRSGAGITVHQVTIDGMGNGVVVAPGQQMVVRFWYHVADCDCPGCFDQIEVGYADESSFEYCAYEGIPGCRGVTSSSQHTFVAPLTAGTYALRFALGQDRNCSGRRWSEGAPAPAQTMATVCVLEPR